PARAITLFARGSALVGVLHARDEVVHAAGDDGVLHGGAAGGHDNGIALHQSAAGGVVLIAVAQQVGVLLVHGDGAVIVHGDVQLGAGEHDPLAGDDQLPDSLDGFGGAGGHGGLVQGGHVHEALSQTAVVGGAAHGVDEVLRAAAGHGGLDGGVVVHVPVPDGGGQVGLRRVGGHVGVIAAAEHAQVLSGDLRLSGVAVLGDDAAVEGLDQLPGESALVHLVGPGAQLLHVHGGVGVDGLHAQGEAVDAGGGLRVLAAEGGHIAHVVVAGLQALQTGGDAGQVAGLIGAAEVVVEVGLVGHVAGGVGEHHVGVLLRLVGQGLHIAEGDAEDDVAALAHQGVHSGGHGVIVLRHLVHYDQLSVRVQTQLLHGEIGRASCRENVYMLVVTV